MFRAAKKKPKKRAAIRRKDDDQEEETTHESVFASAKKEASTQMEGDEEEEDPPVIIRRRKESSKKEKKSRKRGLAATLSGDHAGTKKKKKTSGLGFGGGMTTVIDEDEMDFPPAAKEEDPYTQTTEQGSTTSQAYGAEALQALKAAQKVAKPKDLEEVATSLPSASEPSKIPPSQQEVPITDEDGIPDERIRKLKAKKLSEKSYISLTGNDMDEDEEDVGETLLEKDGQPMILEDPDDFNWQEQVAKRAGVANTATNNGSTRRPLAPRTAIAAPTLDALRQTLQDTMHHLSTREEDLGNVIMRRQADLAQTISNRKRQQASIETSGRACGYYQKLRYDLAMWVGALRDLEEKVTSIQKSLLDMVELHLESVGQEWRHWQQDACMVLHQAGLLDRILGQSPPDLIAETVITTVDEFGREIGSQWKRDREKRFMRRRKRAEELADPSEGYDEILELLMTKEEGSDRRYQLLQEALRVALEDVDDTYASPANLKKCFDVWKEDYPDEYRQCYAHLSLAELVHVFDQVELCRAPWIRSFLKHGENIHLEGQLFPSTIDLFAQSVKEDEDDDAGNDTTASMERAYKKDFFPVLNRIFRENSLPIFLSTGLSHFFANAIDRMLSMMGPKSALAKEICGSIGHSATQVVQSIVLPLLKTAGTAASGTELNLKDTLLFVRRTQPKWLHVLFLNLLGTWMPVVQRCSTEQYEAMGKTLLGFLSDSYLYFLSSLPDSRQATAHLSPIWELLVKHHETLLESPDYILQSAPLRAAASAYDLPGIGVSRGTELRDGDCEIGNA